MLNFREVIETHRLRMQVYDTAVRVWNNSLTEEERGRLGDLDYCYRKMGVAGFYAVAKRISLDRAVIELARQFGMPDFDYHELLKEIAPDEVAAINAFVGRPVWDRKSCILMLNGKEIRRIIGPQRAKNIVAILDQFEYEKWPYRIETPRCLKGDIGKFGQAVRSLNLGLKEIRFERDGTGSGIRWRATSSDPRSN